MTAPLHERLDADGNNAVESGLRTLAAWEGDDLRTKVVRDIAMQALQRIEALAAALRPPEGEVGALCERLERMALYYERLAKRHPDSADLRAALAHLRRLAAGDEWKLVPLRSTEAMGQAAYEAAGCPSEWYGFAEMWDAALAAAPATAAVMPGSTP